jgi:hypothetical protein
MQKRKYWQASTGSYEHNNFLIFFAKCHSNGKKSPCFKESKNVSCGTFLMVHHSVCSVATHRLQEDRGSWKHMKLSLWWDLMLHYLLNVVNWFFFWSTSLIFTGAQENVSRCKGWPQVFAVSVSKWHIKTRYIRTCLEQV